MAFDVPADRWRDDSDPVFHRAVDPYRSKGTIYLKQADVGVHEGVITSAGRFGIAESCYIDDTGHFNAAEFIICYNQLMYYSIARIVEESLSPAFEHWTLDDFWQRQLPDVLIHKLSSTYSRPISARAFEAEFRVEEISLRAIDRGMLTLATSVTFWDATGGRARGTVDLALVNAPRADSP